MEYMVEMRHITKRFPGIVANDDVTIQIRPQEIFALLGENGAGKSTLMSMLFGMYEPDDGEIWIRGERVRITSPNQAAGLNIGMVHQHFKLVQNFTAAENIVLGTEPVKRLFGALPRFDKQQAEQQIRDLSHKYGLEIDPAKRISDMDVSARQRVEILKMLYRRAEILIFDEPTAVLTPQEIRFLLKIIRELKDQGKTVILISHKLEEIKQIADRCAVLNHGRLTAVRDVKDTSTREMAALMIGNELPEPMEKKEIQVSREILRVEHLTVENKNHLPVVRDVSFSVRGGEIFAVAGVAGNGQIELADAIAGLLKAKDGGIYLNGADISQFNVKRRIVSGLSYIPEDRQTTGLVLNFSLADNLILKKYGREPFSRRGILNPDEIGRYAEELIGRYDIRSARGKRSLVRSMSGGNQQKAVIGREIDLQNPLLIFVQPTRGLDIGAIDKIHRQILKEREAGKAILLISLELDEIMKLSDTVGVIYNGAMTRISDAKSLTADQIGAYMMGVKGA